MRLNTDAFKTTRNWRMSLAVGSEGEPSLEIEQEAGRLELGKWVVGLGQAITTAN